MTEILVDFESKKEAIATWVTNLTGLPHENIRGADQTGKIQYPACVINEIIEIDTHRPIRQAEEIDDELKTVVYASRKVMLDVAFISRSKGDYGATPSDRFEDAYYYMTRFQGGLYLPETSIEYFSTNGLSILSAAAPRRDDTPRDDGWQRKRIMELGLGYVHQSVESLQTIERIDNVKGSVYVADQKIDLEINPWVGIETLDQEHAVGSASPPPAASWQSFTAGLNGYLNRVEIAFGTNRSNVIFKIYLGEGTAGSVLAEKSGFSVSTGVNSIELDSPIWVSAGTQYTIYISTFPYNVAWKYNKIGTYPGGRSALDPDYDHFFRTFVLR